MRKLSGFWKVTVSILSISLVLFHIYTTMTGILSDIYQRDIHLGFVLTLCFLLKPATKNSPKDRVPFYDIIFACLSLISAVYVATIYGEILWDPNQWLGSLDIFLAVTTTFLVLEAGRRTVGWVFIILLSCFGIYAYFGPYFPGIWGHGGYNFSHIFQVFYHSTNGLWGIMTGTSATLLAMFAVFSSVLSETGGAATFVSIGQKLVGNRIGGQGKVALISGGLFGMISGSALANVMATGSFTIPMMKKAGYTKEWSAATCAVGSTGGQIMPPIMGAGAFIMAQLLGISYLDISIAAAIPALLYYLAAFMSLHFVSCKMGIKGGEGEVETLTFDRYFVVGVPIIIFLYFLIKRYTVDWAAFLASVGGFLSFVIVFAKKEGRNIPLIFRRALSLLHKIAIESAAAILSMAALLASAQLVITLIQLSGFGIKISQVIVSVGEQNLFLCLFFSMIVCAILGMGLPTTAAYVLAGAVLAPPLIGLGVQPLVAHLFVFYYATLATITPPVCAAVYLSAGMAEANWLKTGCLSVMLGLPVFIIPYAFAYNGILIMDFAGESIFNIVLAFTSAFFGVVAIAMGVAGYNKKSLNMLFRIICVIAGILMIVPMVAPSLLGMAIFSVIFFFTRSENSQVGQRT